MSKLFCKAGCFLLLGLIFMHFSASAQFLNWTYEDILTDETFSGANPDVAVAANGDLYMSFWDEDTDQLYFAVREKQTGIWTREAVAPQINAGFQSAIAIDAMGRPHIAFFENVNEEADLVHAYKDGNWIIEYISKDTLWGSYRSDFELTSFRKPSLDLTFDQQGNPVIAFFDAKVYAVGSCRPGPSFTTVAPTYYEMDLNIAAKTNNSWQIVDLDLPITTFPNCVVVPDKQDRFGEFCKIIASGDSFMVVTNALYNHDLMLFTSSPSDINSWKSIRLDSVERSLNSGVSYEEGFHFPEISIQGDSVLHIAYGVSRAYGLLSSSPGGRRNMFYTQVDLRNPEAGLSFYDFFSPPEDQVMRSFFALSSIGEDSIYLAHYDLRNQLVVLTQSNDKGINWVSDTVFREVSTNTPLLCEIIGDSLFVGVYDAKNRLFRLSARQLSGSAWQYGLGTQSEQRASVFGAIVEEHTTENISHLVFDETVSGELIYGKGTPGNWQYETLTGSAVPFQEVDITLDDQAAPWIAFTQRNDASLYVAARRAGNWEQDTLPVTSPAENPILAYAQDSIHIIYIDRGRQHIMHAFSAGNGSWIRQSVDSMVLTGRPHAAKSDINGRIHVAYVRNPGMRITHAVYENGKWTTSFVTDSAAYTPNSLDIQTRSDNSRPAICFKDIINNEILLTEQQTDSIWRVSQVLLPQQRTLGNSLKMILDPLENPWILYSFVGDNEELRLLRRETDRFVWQPVTVNNNPGRIGSEFDFQLVGLDFYILGRKTRVADAGIAMLYAPEGVTTEIDLIANAKEFRPRIFPNPTTKDSRLAFENAFSETVRITVFDVQGRKVGEYSLLPHEKSLLLRTESLQAGLYIVCISAGTQQLQLKWVIMK